MSKRKRTDDELFVINPDRRMGNLKGCLIMTLTGMIRKASDDDLHALFAATMSRRGTGRGGRKESLSLETLPAKGSVKHPFIRAAAREMGVGIGHLWSALSGKPGFRDRAMLASRYRRIAARLQREGRPVKSKPQYAGINRFSKQLGVSPQFVRDVLSGKETSGRIADAWKRCQQTLGTNGGPL